MLSPVQPHGLQFVERRANGRGADGAFGQVGANAGDALGTHVRAVDVPAGGDDHALCIGQ